MYEWVLQRTREGRDKDLLFGVGPEDGGEAAEEDAGIGSDGRLSICLGLSEEAEEVVVEDTVVELCYQLDRRKGRTLEDMG